MDAKLFCLLHSCRNPIKKVRLIHYIYMMQQFPRDFEFSYKFKPSGLYSDSLDAYISEMACAGMIYIDDGFVQTTPKGDNLYSNVVLSMEEWDYEDWLYRVAENLTDAELSLACMSDLLVQDTLRRYGVDGLMTEKQRICDILSTLSKVYTMENFNNSLKLFRHIRSGIA